MGTSTGLFVAGGTGVGVVLGIALGVDPLWLVVLAICLAGGLLGLADLLRARKVSPAESPADIRQPRP